MKAAVIYSRVSTAKQKYQGDSLEQQEKDCKIYCKNNNIKTIKVFKDDFTGTTSNRPALNELYSYLENNKGKIDYCIIKHIDRNTRGGVKIHNEIKSKLFSLGVQLKDTYGIIQEKIKVIDKVGEINLDYDFCYSEPSQTSETIIAISSEEERKQILRRTIPKECILEQQGYHVRESNFGYSNKKIKTNEGKKTIQVEHHIEGTLIKNIFKLKAENKLSNQDIVDEINLMGYKSRRGKKLNIKQMQVYLKRPVYAGVIVSKWTGNKAIRAAYQGLITINTWNKVNSGKQKIIELSDGTVKIVNAAAGADENVIKRRSKYNPNLPYRNLIKSSLIENRMITGSYSNPTRKNPTGYYHPNRKKGELGENIKKEILEENVHKLFDAIKIIPVLKEIFNDRFEIIFEENKNELLKNKNILINRLKEINKEIIDEEETIPGIRHLPKILEVVNKKLENLEIDKLNLENKIEKLESSNYLNSDGFKKFSFDMLEHLTDLLKNSRNLEELQLIFKFVFKETPTYDEIVNRTAKLFPIFALNTKKEPQLNGNSSINLKWQPH